MDVPSSGKYIHPTRWVHAKNCKKNLECNVPKSIWTAWASKVKAYVNICDGRSFAEVLKKGISKKFKVKQVVPTVKLQRSLPEIPSHKHLVSIWCKHPRLLILVDHLFPGLWLLQKILIWV